MAATMALTSALLKVVSEAMVDAVVSPYTLNTRLVSTEFVTVGPGVGNVVGDDEGNGVGLPTSYTGAEVGWNVGKSVTDMQGAFSLTSIDNAKLS